MKTKTKLTLLLGLILTTYVEAQVLPPHSTLFGKTMADYSAEWFMYNWSLSTNQDAVHLPAGPRGDPVYFLAASEFGDPTQQHIFTVPENVFVFFPIIANWADNVDTIPPLSIEQLRNLVAQIMDLITNVHATIDGALLPELLEYREKSPVFSMYFETADNAYSRFIGRPFTGLNDPIVADGWYLMLEPLRVGTYTLSTGATFGPPLEGYSGTNTFQIKVVPIGEFLSLEVGQLVRRLEGLEAARAQPLLASLNAAKNSFDSENLRAGINQLHAFQNKVRAQIARADPALADELSNAAQRITDKAAAQLDSP